MHRSSTARSHSFHQSIAVKPSALQPRSTLAEELIGCALAFSGDVEVAKSIGSNVSMFPDDESPGAIHEAIVDCLRRHMMMGGAVSDVQMAARSLCRRFLRWHSAARSAA